MTPESTAPVRWFNASILVIGSDGKNKSSYGVFLDDVGQAIRCSEHSAVPDPIKWLSERYPDNGFCLVEDNGDAYYKDLKRDLFPDKEES